MRSIVIMSGTRSLLNNSLLPVSAHMPPCFPYRSSRYFLFNFTNDPLFLALVYKRANILPNGSPVLFLRSSCRTASALSGLLFLHRVALLISLDILCFYWEG